MTSPRISIIILNWNGWKDTVECLESLYQVTYPNYDVVVIDNGSEDDSIKKIKEYCKGKLKVNSRFFEYNPRNKPIKVFEIDERESKLGKFNRPLYEKYDPNRRLILIKNRGNYGFTGGNNTGMKFVLSVLNPDFVLLLNNDIVTDPNFLSELIKAVETDIKTGIAGPKIYYYDSNGRTNIINFTGADLIPWKGSEKRYGVDEEDNGQWDKTMSVDKIEGSCMLIRKDVIERVGFFDESFFCYWEETDLCIRAKKEGYKLIYVPNAKIWHKIAVSSMGMLSPFYIYHITRNKFFFLRKNYPGMLRAHLFYFLLWEFWFNLGRLLMYRRNLNAFHSYLKGVLSGLFQREY